MVGLAWVLVVAVVIGLALLITPICGIGLWGVWDTLASGPAAMLSNAILGFALVILLVALALRALGRAGY